MKVLMLGWEYPPHISGGLGTACEGLTVALSRLSVSVDFVVPQLFGGEAASHMTLIDSAQERDRFETGVHSSSNGSGITVSEEGGIRTTRIPALLSPYWGENDFEEYVDAIKSFKERVDTTLTQSFPPAVQEVLAKAHSVRHSIERYSGDIFGEVRQYTENVVALLANRDFDVIHAHDWMTFPAGVALSRVTGKPLVVHVHSLEYDRSGRSVNPRINEIERMGVQASDLVIAVSHYTRTVIEREHSVGKNKIEIVHNGVYPKEVVQRYRHERAANQKVVLFLGRITFQKGPEYFVEAAARVIPHVPEVLFVMAGSGDMLPRMVERVREMGLEKHFRFPGFLRGEEVEQMFSIADLYVMPSVSEPFGISALEAISFDTPVIISRQSGVSEVLGHALKVDFWDVNRMADLIINGLVHPELRSDMVSMAREEVKRLRWDAAALKTIDAYRRVIQ